MQAFPTLFNKTSDDLPESLDEKSMVDICNQYEIDYEYHKINRSTLIRFYPIRSEFKDLDCFTSKSGPTLAFTEVKYYWNGENYIKNNRGFKFSGKDNCYIPTKKYYVYIIVGEDSRLYVGSYTSYDKFENDNYYGSFTDKTFKPIKKIKVCECSSRTEAYKKERELQTILQVDSNSDFANKCIESVVVSS